MYFVWKKFGKSTKMCYWGSARERRSTDKWNTQPNDPSSFVASEGNPTDVRCIGISKGHSPTDRFNIKLRLCYYHCPKYSMIYDNNAREVHTGKQ